MIKKLVVFFACLTLYAIFFVPEIQAVTYDLTTTTNWNIRFDGESASDKLGDERSVTVGDLNNDGLNDLVVAAPGDDNNSRSGSGSVYVIYSSVFSSLTSTANTVDLGTSTKYNLRYEGASAGDAIGEYVVETSDIDSDGKLDLLIGTNKDDNNSRSNSGSLFIIYNTLLDDYTGTGNNIDLNTATNYNLRYDGAVASDQLTSSGGIVVADMDSDSKKDIAISSLGSDYNSRSGSGSVFVIYNSLIDDYSGTGNNIDLATATNFNLRYDGPTASDLLGEGDIGSGDLDSDGKADLFLGADNANFNSRTLAGSIYVIYNTLIDDYSSTGNTIDLATATNYNLRYDGAAASDWLSSTSTVFSADLDNDNKEDLIFGTPLAPGELFGGYIYIFYNTLIDNYSGTGNNIDLATATNYNIRYTGSSVDGDEIGNGVIRAADFDYDSKLDLIFLADTTGASNTGALYVIYNSLLDDLTGTGNNIDPTDTAYFSLRYDAGSTSDGMASGGLRFSDVNNDSRVDIVIGSRNGESADSESNTGNLFVIYNFPHSFSINNIQPAVNTAFNMTGTISATNSPTAISGVEFRVADNTIAATWTSCSATDGSFNSTSESFTCSVPGQAIGSGTIYLRAYDANTSYTAQSSYATATYIIPPVPPANTSGGENTTAPAPALDQTAGGTVSGSPDSLIIVEPGAIPFASNVSHNSYPAYDPPVGTIRPFAGVGDIHQIWLTDFYNGSRILPSVQKRPSIVSLKYNRFQLLKSGGGIIPESSLRLAYSADGLYWIVLSTSVVDTVNDTVSAIHKIGGYYMIVSRARSSYAKPPAPPPSSQSENDNVAILTPTIIDNNEPPPPMEVARPRRNSTIERLIQKIQLQLTNLWP